MRKWEDYFRVVGRGRRVEERVVKRKRERRK